MVNRLILGLVVRKRLVQYKTGLTIVNIGAAVIKITVVQATDKPRARL